MPDISEAASHPQQTLLDALKGVYEEDGELSAWEDESRIYPQALSQLVEELKDAYIVERPLKLGSTATVWKLRDKKLNQPRALKLPRPRLSRLKSIVRVIRGERDKLATLNHQNIIKIYTAGELKFPVESDNYSFPYFVMEFLEGVQDLADFIKKSALRCSALDLIGYFRNILAGLDYLHREGIVHCDIKPENILIAPGRPALITDFGYAKHFPRPGNQAQKTEVTFTVKYGHPALRRRITDSSDKNANVAEIPRSELQKAFDLYAFGRSLLEVLRTHIEKRKVAHDDVSTDFTSYQRQFVSIVGKRLLDGCVENVSKQDLESDMVPGLTKPVMDEIKYRTPEEALGDLEKLLHLYSIEGDVPELNPNIAAYVQIPHSRVPLTPRVEDIINHPTFTRMAQITQLGFVSFVYPGAFHTRYEHVLGTFAHCCEYVRALWHDDLNPLFQCLMTRHDIEVLLAAALLHDIGQYPMAHDLGEVSSEFAHERFAAQMLEVGPPLTNESLADVVLGSWGVRPDELVDVWSAGPRSSFKCRLLKSIISGPLDCDKLDYLRRDCTHLGVTFGLALDQGRLLRNITAAYAPRTEPGEVIPEEMNIVGLGVAEKALVVAESLVRIRKDLFTQVYWHHTVRSLKAMLGFAVRNILLSFDEVKKSDEENKKQEENREAFWSAFHAEVLWLSRLNRAQSRVLEGLTNTADAVTTEEEWLGHSATVGQIPASSLSPTDDALLLFFRRFARQREQEVIDAMRARRVFKRLYVLTFSRKEETAYDLIYNRFHTYRLAGKLDEIERLREACERLVREEVLGNEGGGGRLAEVLKDQPVAEVADWRNRIATADPLILLDVPVKAVSPSTEAESIWYLPEDVVGTKGQREGERQFFTTPVPLEQTPFDKASGKIRVFAPADLKDILLRCIPKRTTFAEFLTR